MEIDLLNPVHDQQKEMHKLKRLIPSPNSYFLDVKCKECQAVSTVFSHAQSIIQCEGFSLFYSVAIRFWPNLREEN